VLTRGVEKASNIRRKSLPLDRGKSGYAAHLRWKNDNAERRALVVE
jgi:hypothetical protein